MPVLMIFAIGTTTTMCLASALKEVDSLLICSYAMLDENKQRNVYNDITRSIFP